MPDDARDVAFDPRAPADERHDALSELQRVHTPSGLSSLLPSEDVQKVIDHIQQEFADQQMAKAVTANLPGRNRPAPRRGMQSVQVDDLQVTAVGEFYGKQSGLNFDALRTMVEQTPVLAGVVLTRIRQVSRFCQPSEDNGPGFAIRHVDKNHKLAGAEVEVAKALTTFFQNCGWEFNPRARKRLKRDSFTQFMAKSVRDTLTMDACPIETEWKRDRSRGIDGFYAVDGASIRLCSEEGYGGDDEIFAVQVVSERVATVYTHDQLIYEVRNPRTDLNLGGYGMGEAELLVRTVTGYLNAMQYNITGFDNNAIPKGMLHLSGNYDSNDLVSFKRYWNAMVKGVNNAWTLPVMISKEQESKASFEKFGVDFSEMAFSKWMTFLTSIICAIYGMDPAEINFESFSAQKSSLSGSDTTEKLAASLDKGLRPLMAFFEAEFTDFLVTEFDPQLCFRWVGLDEEDQDKLFEKQRLVSRVDELRNQLGLEPDPDYGSAPLNPSLVGVWQAKQQQAMQPQEPGPDYGEPDDEGDDQGGAAQGGGTDGGSAPSPANGDAGASDAQAAAPPFGGRGATGGFGGKEAEEGFGKALPIFAVTP